ncbi:serine/arginine-rich splicing factor SC35 isoform X2 [Cryptomeria japonica]|nr:serine/arginine-rich splicing factor SC35 isoform X2 [Cryptomeria japonica]
MAHFGRAGPPDIKDSYSLLVLNITFRTTADDLYPLFDRYGKVVDIFIPRDRRTGDSRGFAFVRYKYADEAEKAIERLDGRNVDGRDIVVQFAKYGPNAEVIRKGRLTEEPPTSKRHRSRSPRRSSKRVNDDYRYRDYRRRSRSRDRHDNHRYQEKEREYRRRSLSHSASPRSLSRSRSRDTNDGRTKRSRSRSVDSRSPVRHSRSHRSLTPQRHVPDKSSPSTVRSPAPASLSPNARNKSPKPPSMSPSNSG